MDLNNAKTGIRVSYIVAAASFAVCLAVRMWQICAGTDMNTGFLYKDNGPLLDWGYYALIALTFAAALAAAFLDAKKCSSAEELPQTTVDGRAAVLGFGMLLTGVCAVYEGVREIHAVSPSMFVITTDFICGAAMAAVAFVTLYKKEFTPGLGFSYFIGGAYFTLRGIAVFLTRMAIVTVPEYLIEALCVIGGAVFFMLLSKLLSGNGRKHTLKWATAFGAATSVLTLSSGLATIILSFAAPEGISDRITQSSYTAEFFFQQCAGIDGYLLTYTPWVNMAMGLFTAAALVVINLGAKREDSPGVN